MIRYGVYFGAAFVLVISLPALLPAAGNWVPVLWFYAPFFYLSERLYEILEIEFLRRPMTILAMGTVFWAGFGGFVGLFFGLWPFRSHLFLRVAVALFTFTAGVILLYSAAQLAESLR